MLRGVNKNIIEVSDPENKYFEKAILFVRPVCKNKPEEVLNNAAHTFLSTANTTQSLTTVTRTKPLKLKIKHFVALNIKYVCMLLAAVSAFILFGSMPI